jgi:hydroxymethylbilane synthase
LQAERAVLAALGGSCTVPVGAWAETAPDSSRLTVHGLLASGDGRTMIRMTRSGDDPTAVGIDVARALVIDGGGYGLDGFDDEALRQALASGSP